MNREDNNTDCLRTRLASSSSGGDAGRYIFIAPEAFKHNRAQPRLVEGARRGVVLMLVLVAVAIATTLAYSFVSSQATTISITRNVENQTQARYIAESGMAIAIAYVRNTDTWRDDQSNGVWVASASFGGGTYSIRGEDGADDDGDDVISQPSEGDGDLDDDSGDPMTLTVTGIHDGSTHTVRAVLTPQGGAADQLFWIDKGDKRIYRSELDGSDKQIVVTGVEARDIAIDSVNKELYWIDKDAKRIRRSDLDGGNVENVINGVNDGFALAVDPDGGKVYWADKDVEKIRRANLDGSGTQDIVNGAKEVLALEVDATGGKIYWADKDAKNIYRANLDGSNSQQLVSNVAEVVALALDSDASRLYWSNIDNESIRSSSLTGSSVSTVVSGFAAHGVAVHPSSGKLYWSHKDQKTIQQADLDGSNAANIATGFSEPTAVTVGGGSSSVGSKSALLIVPASGAATAQDSTKKSMIEGWGFTVTLFTASSSQSAYDTAVSAADVIYISEDVSSGDVGSKLNSATIGVVIEESALNDDMHISSSTEWYFGYSQITVISNSHYITQPFSLGTLTLTTATTELTSRKGTLASGLTSLSTRTANTDSTLEYIEADGMLTNGSSAAGRRVFLPWGGESFDVNLLTADGQLLMRRSLEWAAHATGGIGGATDGYSVRWLN